MIAGLLGIKAEAAKNGEWWEIDLILIILFGAATVGIIAWASM